MADCCETKTPKSKQAEMRQFLIEKATNFRNMLEPFCITPENKEYLSKYNESQVEEVVLLYLAPFYKTGTLALAQDAIVNQLEIADAAIKEKIGRYLTCFCECLL
jgi:protoheme ferro-lyase